ncbi:MAG: PVC-type heme-binding CxxCH protein [Tepidisphaeraceae bacterium]
MSRPLICLIAFLLLVFATAPAQALAADPFAVDIRTTEPLPPAEQQKTFKLQEGFEIQLVAADPDINKPMNLAFDARGRLWVTETHLYPIPAKDAAAKKDCIKVLEDADGDGRAEKITTFADNLDIPVGILPLGDGRSVIAYDINNICLYSDTDNDGKADKREVLYSGFGFEDTHGMASNFRRGFDGWVYGCHGFRSKSEVRDKSGNVTKFESGNTYRFRLDGSKFEVFTIGQINPFGMSMDPLGNIYTSDSHSKPIYQMLRGGRYEAFDRNTDDGLGLAPMTMTHLHGSTAIAGSCFYAADAFPEEFRNNVFVGNVATGRINRDTLQYTGSSPKAIEQPDFLITTDPWFRPVNTILGPDGALYVADFYNRVIAHYEIKLDHPGRDYQRGRIWKISFAAKNAKRLDFTKADVNQLIAKLDDANMTNRMFALSELSDRVGKDAVVPLTALLEGSTATTNQKVHALWALYRQGELPSRLLQQAVNDPQSSVRVHIMRILAETPAASPLAIKGLTDGDALVRRCAADALGQHPDVQNVRPLLDALAAADRLDTHFVHVLRMSLRNQLKPEGSFAKLEAMKWSAADVRALADVSLAIESPDAAAFLLTHIGALAGEKESLTRYLRHAVRFAAAAPVEPIAKLMRERFPDDLDLQLDLFQSIRKGMAQRGQALGPAGDAWGVELVAAAMKTGVDSSAWTITPLDPTAAVVTTWGFEQRNSADGKPAMLLSSLPGGEQITSVLKSKPFAVPSKLSFFLAGHNGFPETNPKPSNVVRLRAADSNEVLAEALPPRNDTAAKIDWELQSHSGKQAYLEVTDADSGTGFAWLALGRFDPPVIQLPRTDPRAAQVRLRQVASIAGEMNLTAAAPQLIAALLDRSNDTETRGAIAQSLSLLKSNDAVGAMKQIIADTSEVMPLRDRVAQALGQLATPAAQAAIVESFRLAPRELQTSLAIALTSNTAAAETLLTAVAAGKAPARLLLELGIHDRLAAAKVQDLEKRVKKLTRGVAAPKEEVDKLIGARRADFKSGKPIPPEGSSVFAKNCMACHQVDGKGGVVGPQLAGMGKRGIDRLVEDVLDPNRNVDPAFRYSTLILKDGSLITGLQRREEGELLVFADTTGKEVSVKKPDIRQRIESPSSLMPSNFDEIIAPGDFNNLMAYLLSK